MAGGSRLVGVLNSVLVPENQSQTKPVLWKDSGSHWESPASPHRTLLPSDKSTDSATQEAMQ